MSYFAHPVGNRGVILFVDTEESGKRDIYYHPDRYSFTEEVSYNKNYMFIPYEMQNIEHKEESVRLGDISIGYMANCGLRLLSYFNAELKPSKELLEAIDNFLNNFSRNTTWICTGNTTTPIIKLANSLGFETLFTFKNPNSLNVIDVKIRYANKEVKESVGMDFELKEGLFEGWFLKEQFSDKEILEKGGN